MELTKAETDKRSEKPPLVSVIIPAYKASTFISETLGSVLSQTFTDYEVILINDGSPDTDELERALEPYNTKITYLKQPNCGAAAARNAGLRLAKGEFIAFLDADDHWVPSYLEEQIAFLKKNDADVTYCDAELVGDRRYQRRTYMDLAPSRCAVTPESLLVVDVGLITSGVVARKTLVYQVGLFDESIKRGHDFDLWLRLAQAKAKFACNKKVLLTYNICNQGLSGDTVSQLERRLQLLSKIQARGNLSRSEESALLENLTDCAARLELERGRVKLLNKDYSGAIESFQEARKLRSNWKLVIVCVGLRLAPQLFWRFYKGYATVVLQH
jgi:GT2 family glycosyltransferase